MHLSLHFQIFPRMHKDGIDNPGWGFPNSQDSPLAALFNCRILSAPVVKSGVNNKSRQLDRYGKSGNKRREQEYV